MANRKTPPNALKLEGKTFGKLTVIKRAGRTKNGSALWLCQCECGNTKVANATSLRRGDTISCGCDKRKQIDNARNILMTAKSVDGVQIPILTKKVRSDSGTGYKGVHRRVRKGRVYYEPSITVKGKRIFGKQSTDLNEAVRERKRLEEIYHKPYIESLTLPPKVKDIRGKKFGRLIPVEYLGESRWLCNCDCGNQTTVKTGGLQTGATKSCGCLRRERSAAREEKPLDDLSGKRYGRLTVLGYAGKSSWLCRCECGNEKTVKRSSLINGLTKSCGCLQKELTSVRMKNNPAAKEAIKKSIENDPYRALRRKVRADNKSGVKGVRFNKHIGKWIANIAINGKQIYLGSYAEFDDAVRARKEAEEEYHKPLVEESYDEQRKD